MKKSLIALAVLTASGISFAQSSVTLFGGADLNYRSVESGTNKFSGMAQDGIYSSRFGVMGVEDLGGGLKAGFHFEGGMNPDTGTAGGFNFTRKSTVGVMGVLVKFAWVVTTPHCLLLLVSLIRLAPTVWVLPTIWLTR
jgi:predicted porin